MRQQLLLINLLFVSMANTPNSSTNKSTKGVGLKGSPQRLLQEARNLSKKGLTEQAKSMRETATNLLFPKSNNDNKSSQQTNNDIPKSDMKKVMQLINNQRMALPLVLEDLQSNGAKTGHYSWWVWPTEMVGMSEPPPSTCVTTDTAEILLQKTDLDSWTKVLNTFSNLIEDRDGLVNEIIPTIDFGRIRYFLRFWLNDVQNITMKYPSFYEATCRFEKQMSNGVVRRR